MKINEIRRPWSNDTGHRHNIRKDNSDIYKTSSWKKTVDFIWVRDKGMCQLCLQQGIKHQLTRGTTDLSIQGTVDHKEQRIKGGSDNYDNLWLIGSNHHNAKSARERNTMYKKK